MQWKRNDIHLLESVCSFGFQTFADLKNRFQLKWKKLASGRFQMALSIKSSTRSPSTIANRKSQLQKHSLMLMLYFLVGFHPSTIHVFHITAHITIQLFECKKYFIDLLPPSTLRCILLKLSINTESIKWIRAMHLGCVGQTASRRLIYILEKFNASIKLI